MAVRDHILSRFLATQAVAQSKQRAPVYYFSLEYLMGRLLESNLHSTGLSETVVAAVARSRPGATLRRP